MRTSVVIVSLSLTLAIVLVAGFLIATQAHGHDAHDPHRTRCAATCEKHGWIGALNTDRTSKLTE